VSTPSSWPLYPASFLEKKNKEHNSIKLVADIAVEKQVEYFIFSTLPNVSKISGGKYTAAHHFDGKAEAEEYIRSLPIKSSFVSVGGYFQNVEGLPPFQPRKVSDDTWAIILPLKPTTAFPLLDADGDVGKFVSLILTEPEKYTGQVALASENVYTQPQIADILSKTTGQKVIYQQIPMEEFKAGLPFGADIFAAVLGVAEEFGYYGKDTEKLVRSGPLQGKLTTLQQYFEKNILKLE